MKKLANLLALLSGIASALLFIHNRVPNGFYLYPLKLFSGAVAPWTALMGAAATLLGLLTGQARASLAGALSALVSARFVRAATAPHDGFERAFGPDWKENLPDGQKQAWLPQRWSWLMPRTTAEPRWERDVAFCTIPGSKRDLLCDVWQPPQGIQSSGLAYIYFHGSAWTLMDKDFATRAIFRHLAGQGHVIMDVAYRLYPETDIDGMVADVKRAVAWMKDNASRLGVDPRKIVIGGGSAGGHISLLAAYAPESAGLTPPDVQGRDLSVRAVISTYGPTDLRATYYHTNQDKTTRELPVQTAPDAAKKDNTFWLRHLLKEDYHRLHIAKGGNAGAFIHLLGAHPDQDPQRYARLSPIQYTRAGLPPTLLLHGETDMMVPVESTRELYHKLIENGVPAVLVTYPQAEHGFDLALLEVSPVAQAALYETERFLAVMAE